jgi:hypothetical protein
MALDIPQNGSVTSQNFFVGGWAIDRSASTGVGVDAVHVYAYPNNGTSGTPIFLGVANLGGGRPDIGVAFGNQFINSGYNFLAQGLPPGAYQLVVFSHSTVSGTFNNSRSSYITVQ